MVPCLQVFIIWQVFLRVVHGALLFILDHPAPDRDLLLLQRNLLQAQLIEPALALSSRTSPGHSRQLLRLRGSCSLEPMHSLLGILLLNFYPASHRPDVNGDPCTRGEGDRRRVKD
jgi:hypothetical protein